MGSTFLIIAAVVLLAGFGAVVFMLLALRRRMDKPADDQSMRVMMEWMKEIKSGSDATRETVQQSIAETNRAINERLDNAGRVIAGLQRELGSMAQIGPDIRRLSETLASPKLRGNFGEEVLEQLLSQVLPKASYGVQHRFKNGEIVDAIVIVGEHTLPIDSKFSMENFRLLKDAKTDDAADGLRKAFMRDVKKRIDEIHKKYILPQEGTFDFALMYVPSEAIFSEILEDTMTCNYAREKHVHLVSPNTFYYWLQSILLSLRGQKINEAAQHILAMINGIKQEGDKFGRNLDVLSNHIKNANNSMGTVANDFIKLKSSISNAATLKLDADTGADDAKKLLE